MESGPINNLTRCKCDRRTCEQELREKLGICQWFHYQDYSSVERAGDFLRDLNFKHLRTGISWADYHRPGGEEWFRWMLEQLTDFELLLSIWHTPPSIAEFPHCSAPLSRLDDFAGFIWEICNKYDGLFDSLELWNEPNNKYKWNLPGFDPDWKKFGKMIRLAAPVAKRYEHRVVLGGMIPVDPHWLKLLQGYGSLENIDVIAIHAFPEMWWPNFPNWDWHEHWHGWNQKIAIVKQCTPHEIWVTETGLATWDLENNTESRHQVQIDALNKAILAPVGRTYWYSLIDLDPDREAIEGFHVDENEYHLGVIRFDGSEKPIYKHLRQLMSGKIQVEGYVVDKDASRASLDLRTS